jgi:hypothetical protein
LAEIKYLTTFGSFVYLKNKNRATRIPATFANRAVYGLAPPPNTALFAHLTSFSLGKNRFFFAQK